MDPQSLSGQIDAQYHNLNGETSVFSIFIGQGLPDSGNLVLTWIEISHLLEGVRF